MTRIMTMRYISIFLALFLFVVTANAQDNPYPRPMPNGNEAMIDRLESYLTDADVVGMAVSGWYMKNSIASRRAPVATLYPQIEGFIEDIRENINRSNAYLPARPLVTRMELNLRYYQFAKENPSWGAYGPAYPDAIMTYVDRTFGDRLERVEARVDSLYSN